MKSDSFILLLSFACCFVLITASKPARINPQYTAKAIAQVNKQFKQDLADWQYSTQKFKSAVITADSTQIHQTYLGLRVAYKKVEFLLEYLDKEAVDRFINGAPLPKLEPKVAEHVVLEPKGLQVIDELLAQTLDNQVLVALNAQLKQLETATSQLVKFLGSRTLNDRQFFEAARQAVIRLVTLGITGFDTPGTLNGINDSYAVLTSLKVYGSFYQVELETIGQPVLWNQLERLLNKGAAFTESTSFNSFNRVDFISRFGNPLYAQFKKIHLALGYETIAEVSRYMPAVNYQADNIFNSDFLNANYYVSIPQDSLKTKREKLGKLLFYDPILSGNNAMSCASCHNPKRAFTDGLPMSLSNTGDPLTRNALTLNYAVYATGFFHDLRAKRLEDQFEHVVVSQGEFNTDYNQIKAKLEQSNTYLALFEEAFPGQANAMRINNIDYALAAYVMGLNTFDSAVDRFFQGDSQALNPEQKAGFNLFAGKAACATCHFIPLFSGNVPPLFKESESEVLGVPSARIRPWVLDTDIGRRGNGLEKEKADFYLNSFKTPTLRNIALTGPYMHNGVFGTLEEVMEFYNLGGGAGTGMDLPHQTLAADPLALTPLEIQQIIAFMQALTDQSSFNPPQELPQDFDSELLNSRGL